MADAIFDKLRAPFPPDRISWRVGSTTADKKKGMALAYIDARDVMQRLDDVCGPAGWQCRYPHANSKTVCEIGIFAADQWIWKADGAGDSDVEAEKGALSDAFKRAAVRWGIGRYLYEMPSPWVELDAAGRSFKIKDSEYSKLERLLSANAPKALHAVPQPAPEQADPAKIAYITECRQRITRATDPGALAEWWKSEEQKKARRDFELSADEVSDLKNMVMSKLPKKAAA